MVTLLALRHPAIKLFQITFRHFPRSRVGVCPRSHPEGVPTTPAGFLPFPKWVAKLRESKLKINGQSLEFRSFVQVFCRLLISDVHPRRIAFRFTEWKNKWKALWKPSSPSELSQVFLSKKPVCLSQNPVGLSSTVILLLPQPQWVIAQWISRTIFHRLGSGFVCVCVCLLLCLHTHLRPIFGMFSTRQTYDCLLVTRTHQPRFPVLQSIFQKWARVLETGITNTGIPRKNKLLQHQIKLHKSPGESDVNREMTFLPFQIFPCVFPSPWHNDWYFCSWWWWCWWWWHCKGCVTQFKF